MTGHLPTAVRRFLLLIGLVALALGAVQIVAGGFRLDVLGFRFSSRSPVRPLFVALAVAWLLSWRGNRVAAIDDLWWARAALERAAPWVAAAAAATALGVGWVWGTRAAGGSDSYCYIGQAEEFAAGRLSLREPLAREVAIPNADLVFTPVGFVPAPHGGSVPMCAPGLSLVMAVPWKVLGEAGLHSVVPCFAALCIWCTFLLGRRLDGATTGAVAAVLLCASPAFLYQAVQPMSDVPAAALWVAVLVLTLRFDVRGELCAGVVASLAILTRPNLVPLLAPVFGRLILEGRRGGVVRVMVAAAPGCAVLAWLNQSRYGAPWRTGYGDPGRLFSLDHVLPNAERYSAWVLEAQTPFVLLACAAPFLLGRDRPPRTRANAWMGLAFVIVAVGCYVPYTVFDAWWYTRFLLPAFPVALALASASCVALCRRLPLFALLVVPLVAGVAASSVAYARSHFVFELRAFERRFITGGTYVASTPPHAVILAVQQSGAVRHYGRRPAALWDALPPDGLDEAVDALRRAGRLPLLLLEEGEEKGFRERFLSERLGALDWRPAAELRDRVVVRVYDPAEAPQRRHEGAGR